MARTRLPANRKFYNQPTVVAGVKFDSKREARRYQELLLLHQAGEIANLELQPQYPLTMLVLDGPEVVHRDVKIRSKGYPNGRACTYRADFRYQCLRTGNLVVEDVKGFDDARARFKRAVVECIYGIEIQLI